MEANSNTESRTGEITISNGSISETITVIQEGGSSPTISDFMSNYTVELGDDVPLQGVIEAFGNGKLNKVTIKCNNSGGNENTVATIDLKKLNTSTFDLADFKFATTNSNIFSGTGEYMFIIYVSADNFTVTDNSIGSFTVSVTTTQKLPSVVDKGIFDLKGTSVTLVAAIENYGSGTFDTCGFDLYDANGEWITTYTHVRPTNNSNSFQRKVTGLSPETTYYYCPFIETSEGMFPSADDRSLIEFTTAKAIPIQNIELLNGNWNTILNSNIYGTKGDTLTFEVKTTNNLGDIKNVTWSSLNSTIYSIKNSTSNMCTVILNEEGDDRFSVTVTDYYGNEFRIEVDMHVYNVEHVYSLRYSDSLSNEKSGIVLNEHDFVFSSAYFENPSTYYNHNLAKLSFGLILAGQTTTNKDLKECNETAENRIATIKQMYEAYGFKSVKAYNYDEPLSDDNDKIAFTIAQKEILVSNEQYKLIVIATRGGQYGAEWVSNFNVGKLKEGHTGFYVAANGVFSDFKAYCSENGIDITSNVKVLITGYSRSAAVSNIVANRLNKWFEDNKNSKENVYAYTFATPKNTLTNYAQSLVTDYENIFNIVSKDDFVPYVAFGTWGFSRYGKTLYLPQYGTASAKNMLNTLDKLIYPYNNIYLETNGIPFQNWSDQSKAAKQTELLLRYTFGDLDEFRDKYQNLALDLAQIIFNGEGQDEAWDKLKDICFYLITCAIVDQGVGAVSGILKLPIDSIVKFVLDYYISDIVPDLTVVNDILPAFVEAFNSLSDERQNLIVEFITGMKVDTFIEFLLAADTAIFYGGDYLDIFVDVYLPMLNLGGHIIATHRMETYLAWIESADAKTLFSDSFDVYSITVACPVNINIYNAEEVLVGSIVNDEIDTSFDLADSIELSVIEDVKTISIYDDGYYRFELIPISEGSMTITINGTSAVNSGIYEDVSLNRNSEYQLISAQTSNGNVSYELIDAQSDVYQSSEIDNDLLILIKNTPDGNGHSVGGGIVAYNEYVTLTAIPHGNDTFIGWYLNDELVSTETSYSFFARQSINYIAKFTVSSYTVSGTVTSSDSNTASEKDDTITITLANDEHTYTTTITSSGINNTVDYRIENVAAGTYTMTVSKENHVTREYEIVVSGSDVMQDVKIYLLGDVNMDGFVKSNDMIMVRQYLLTNLTLDTYQQKLADTNGNGEIQSNDLIRLRQHLLGNLNLHN